MNEKPEQNSRYYNKAKSYSPIMELQRRLSITTFLFKKYAVFGITYHIPLPWAVFTAGAPQDGVICGRDSLLPVCPVYSFPKETPLVPCPGNPAGTPRAQRATQFRVHPNVCLLAMWTNLSMLHLGKTSPSMLFATQWHLNQHGED